MSLTAWSVLTCSFIVFFIYIKIKYNIKILISQQLVELFQGACMHARVCVCVYTHHTRQGDTPVCLYARLYRHAQCFYFPVFQP